MTPLDPPLNPTPDDARDQLVRELSHPTYWLHRDWVSWLFNWLQRSVSGSGSGGTLQQVGVILALVLVAAVVIVVVRWVLLAGRQGTSAAHHRGSTALVDQGVSAAQYRSWAEEAFAAGDLDTAVAHGFRSLVADLDARRVLGDAPARTAHEVSMLVGSRWPDLAQPVQQAAGWFDRAVYGLSPAPRTTRAQAETVLDLVRRLQRADAAQTNTGPTNTAPTGPPR